ncbi:MAG TPA: helix-turn-helix domain-containing protein, partial [Naasia sp.]
ANDLGRVLNAAPHRAGGQAQFQKDRIRGESTKAPEGPLLDWLRQHLAEPLTLARLAEHEHMSERNLVRRFRQETGMSVFDWIARERVERAKTLLEETDHRIADIAAMVGLGTSESLRRNFERLVGTSARSYRAMFRPPSAGRDADGRLDPGAASTGAVQPGGGSPDAAPDDRSDEGHRDGDDDTETEQDQVALAG